MRSGSKDSTEETTFCQNLKRGSRNGCRELTNSSRQPTRPTGIGCGGSQNREDLARNRDCGGGSTALSLTHLRHQSPSTMLPVDETAYDVFAQFFENQHPDGEGDNKQPNLQANRCRAEQLVSPASVVDGQYEQ